MIFKQKVKWILVVWPLQHFLLIVNFPFSCGTSYFDTLTTIPVRKKCWFKIEVSLHFIVLPSTQTASLKIFISCKQILGLYRNHPVCQVHLSVFVCLSTYHVSASPKGFKETMWRFALRKVIHLGSFQGKIIHV